MKLQRDGTEIYWDCPGCGMAHSIPVSRGGLEVHRNWTWNGDMDSPTIDPSVKARWAGKDGKDKICHFHIRQGRIDFCDDCTHDLKGKSVDMVDY